ncbi:MAG TPA: thiamine diphosphokinase [Chloroflexota bacterium]|nr:thiamine diphosphokinase [Chloroflexota bacterium]
MKVERLHVLIVGSAPVDPARLRDLAAEAGYLICADGGGDAALTAGLTPDLLLGDMDSISPAGRERFRLLGVRVLQHPPEKDKTDLELALEHALSRQPERITITGALGGARLDHTLGNLLLLALPALREVETRIVDGETVARATWSRADIGGRAGDYVSLLPVTDQVEGARTEGLRYPLHGEPLIRGHTRGVSNELLGATASVEITAGCLLIVREGTREE